MRCRNSISIERSHGALPRSACTSASAVASTWRPLGRLLTPRPPRRRDVSTVTAFKSLLQKVAMLLYVRGEIERMLAHEAFGELRIPALERLDDAHVIDDRARRAIALRDREPANRAHVYEQILDRLPHQVGPRQANDRLVERDVRFGIFLDVLGRRLVAEFVE